MFIPLKMYLYIGIDPYPYGSSYIFLDLLRKSPYIDPTLGSSHILGSTGLLISGSRSFPSQNRALQADTLMAPAVEPVEPAEPDRESGSIS